MPAADRMFERRVDHTLDDPARFTVGAVASPHLTFDRLLSDTLHEMVAHEDAPPAEPDAVDRLRDEALVALRTRGGADAGRPFHHASRRPLASSALPSHPPRLDVRR